MTHRKRAMEKRLHNTRHAARQARNSTGRVGSSSSNSYTTSGVSTTTAEKTTTTTASTTKAEVSVPSPSSEPTSNQYQPEEREQPVSPSARYRPQQFCGRQGDSTDEEVEEMEDDAKSPQLAAPTSPAASAPATPSASAPSTASPEQMYEGFQAWALRTYGDSAKTKTVTRKKYQRILKILRGEEQTSAENSKFRFWVKAKGFKTGLPQGHPQQSVHRAALLAAAAKTPPEQLLFVPCSKVKAILFPISSGERVPAALASPIDLAARSTRRAGCVPRYVSMRTLLACLPTLLSLLSRFERKQPVSVGPLLLEAQRQNRVPLRGEWEHFSRSQQSTTAKPVSRSPAGGGWRRREVGYVPPFLISSRRLLLVLIFSACTGKLEKEGRGGCKIECRECEERKGSAQPGFTERLLRERERFPLDSYRAANTAGAASCTGDARGERPGRKWTGSPAPPR
ncbi:hypothetical protein HPB48_006401 [Haemaphysalis longicornis]|uniref:Nucleolar protein 4 n=1 Tax=Haemaphysalis longicornis TaxID=44386 RepID=A0A9J6FKH2_HAELO|nr:hypothetical protein HPB48_006401 [Haemaphysalis longicornis]